MDAFPLPVEGTETRVNAGAEANEFMVQFLEGNSLVGKNEPACGWYHSHPGYGCWLSGIDVQTQMTYQQHQEPWLAIVIDPTRTMAAGKVEIGAFRTYPSSYVPPEERNSDYMPIPQHKIEDFGVHAKKYYSLSVEYFKNALDSRLLEALWNKYWIDTLSSSPLIHNRAYCNASIRDSVSKIRHIEGTVASSSRWNRRENEETKLGPLDRVAIDAGKNASEQLQGLVNLFVKEHLFRSRRCCCGPVSNKMDIS